MDELVIDDTRKRYVELDQELDYSVNQGIEHMLPVFYPDYIAQLKRIVCWLAINLLLRRLSFIGISWGSLRQW